MLANYEADLVGLDALFEVRRIAANALRDLRPLQGEVRLASHSPRRVCCPACRRHDRADRVVGVDTPRVRLSNAASVEHDVLGVCPTRQRRLRNLDQLRLLVQHDTKSLLRLGTAYTPAPPEELSHAEEPLEVFEPARRCPLVAPHPADRDAALRENDALCDLLAVEQVERVHQQGPVGE